MGPVTYMDTTGTAIRTAQSETSETAQSVVASTVGEHLAVGVPATIGYFLAGALVLVVGFIVLDLITPGKLRDLVFLENRAGAAMIAGSQQIALACIVVSVIRASDDDLMMGLGETLVYGALGIVLQAASLLVLEALIPGRFRDVVMDAKVRPRAMLAATTFIVIGVINAVALS
ncbi:DUF350 domain-containing protein [Corynebacterium amycolatum]|uniref:DUF350 domain-containing protein n=1 Tax=Corynebacterium amycolatum TaxID=43765 RepID=UPI000185BFBA|nr:DUF350 domain-containing protein [Corynebacterium amycolatum]EEB63627.1 hypothetical protein CORAM0001_1299 [Corynebacterium amycolatum SK46]